MSEIKTKETVKAGWVLRKGDKFWGMLYPADRSHGGGSAIYGWTNDLEHISVDNGEKMPRSKVWFTNLNSCRGYDQTEGEWVRVEIKTTHSVTPL